MSIHTERNGGAKPVRCGCGGEPVVGHIETSGRWYIGCPDCDICTGLYNTEAEVVQAWNKAMGADKVDELIEHIWREKLDTREKIAELVKRMLR
jgi:hypothetical protein